MLSGSSEFWAAFPPACVNLQLDTSSFTCFSLGYPPLPLPLLPQPGNKLSEIRDLFNFLLSQHPKPRTPALLVHSLVCPIPSPSHRTHPGSASPGEQVAGGPAALRAPGGGTFRECSALPAEWMFYWETDGRPLYLSSFFPIISSLPFLYVFLSFFPYLPPPSPLFSYLFFFFSLLSSFLPFIFFFSLSYLFPFPSLSSVSLSFSLKHNNYRLFFGESVNIQAQTVLNAYRLQRERRRAIPFLHSQR